jgi:hypothetical protein
VLRRWLPLLAVAALLAGAFFAAVYSEPQVDFSPLPVPSQTAENGAGESGAASAPPTESPPAEPRRVELVIPPWVNQILTVVCLLTAVLLAALLVWFVLRDTIQARGRPIEVDPGAPGHTVPRAEEVAAALDAGLAELTDSDTDPRRAVIACWVRLEGAAAEAGTPRLVSDTPADHVLRLLATHRISRPVLDRFASVYRHARYSTGPVDESMRAVAVSALGQLRAELTVPATAGVETA